MHAIINATSRYEKETYDAVWAMSLSLRQSSVLRSVRLNDFTYKRKDMVNSFVKSMESLNFLGVSVSLELTLLSHHKQRFAISGTCEFRWK